MLHRAIAVTLLVPMTVATPDEGIAASDSTLSYPLVDTGQTACYDDDGGQISCPESGEALAGQDAQYSGFQSSYTDNGDGTVSDNVTGLMWQQTPDNIGMSWQEAVGYCSALELAGHDDWGIPTTKELFSISDFSEGWPYLDTTYFSIAGTSVSKDEQYWADYYVGTTVEGGSAAAFGVNHGTGHIKAYAAEVSGRFGNYVRCVRGDTYGVNDFVDNGDGTVTDNATGLMWQQADSGGGMDWGSALAYAESATIGDHNDWRLPNIKELQSIVDYTHSPSADDAANLGPAIDTDFFEITELESGTTNTNPDYGYFWSSTSAYFGGDSLEYYYAWYVAFGTAVDGVGDDFHGAGGMRFDTKYEGGPPGEGGERYYNFVRLVRGGVDAEISTGGEVPPDSGDTDPGNDDPENDPGAGDTGPGNGDPGNGPGAGDTGPGNGGSAVVDDGGTVINDDLFGDPGSGNLGFGDTGPGGSGPSRPELLQNSCDGLSAGDVCSLTGTETGICRTEFAGLRCVAEVAFTFARIYI